MSLVRVLLFLLPDLSPIEFRPVRQSYVAKSLRLTQSRVSGAIAQLVRAGILEETDRRAQLSDRAFVKQYRLNRKQAELGRFVAFVYGSVDVLEQPPERPQLSRG